MPREKYMWKSGIASALLCTTLGLTVCLAYAQRKSDSQTPDMDQSVKGFLQTLVDDKEGRDMLPLSRT
jgi:hypothetical protein